MAPKNVEPPRQAKPNIKPKAISRKARAHIGDILVQSSTIDHLISMALFKLSRIEPANGFALLRQLEISKRIHRLAFFVEAHNDAEMLRAWDAILPQMNNFFTIRNCLAHGVYVGVELTYNGLCFQTYSAPEDVDDKNTFINKCQIYYEDQLESIVSEGAKIEASIRLMFGVQTLHEIFPPQYFLQKARSRKSLRKNKNQ